MRMTRDIHSMIMIVCILSVSGLQIGRALTANKCFTANSPVVITTSIHLSCGPGGQISLVNAVFGVPTEICTVNRSIPCPLSPNITLLPGFKNCNGLKECNANIIVRPVICDRMLRNISVEIVYNCINSENSTRPALINPTTSPHSSEGTNVLIAILSTTLSVLLMVATVLVICMCRSRKKKRNKSKTNRHHTPHAQPHTSQTRLSGTENQYGPVPSPIGDTPPSQSQPEDSGDSTDHVYWELEQVHQHQEDTSYMRLEPLWRSRTNQNKGPSNVAIAPNIIVHLPHSAAPVNERGSPSTNSPEHTAPNNTFNGASGSHVAVFNVLSDRNHNYRSKPKQGKTRGDEHPQYNPNEADEYDTLIWNDTVMNRSGTDQRHTRVHPYNRLISKGKEANLSRCQFSS